MPVTLFAAFFHQLASSMSILSSLALLPHTDLVAHTSSLRLGDWRLRPCPFPATAVSCGGHTQRGIGPPDSEASGRKGLRTGNQVGR